MTSASSHDGVDLAHRERIRHELDTSFVVEASAGTGKTTELVARLTRALATGRTRARGVVAVSFTDRSASELRLRLRAAIDRERARASRAEAAALERAGLELEEARVSTIHALAAELLRERPLEAGVDPAFELMADDASRALLEAVFERWWQRELASPRESVRRLLVAERRGGDELRGALVEASRRLVDTRDFDARWARAPFDRGAAALRARHALEAFGAFAGRERSRENPLAKLASHVARFLDDLSRREAARGADLDVLVAELGALARERAFSHRPFPGAEYGPGVPTEVVLDARAHAHALLQELASRSSAELAALLSDDLREVVAAYEARKRAEGRLDFVDLLLTARALLVSSREARRALVGGVGILCIDEFQDTDPVQVDIASVLASCDPEEADPERAPLGPGKLFVVGDPKQSIYRFRRADLAFYEAARASFVQKGAVCLVLRQSFRAVPELQGFVNAAFAGPFEAGARRDPTSQASYSELSPSRAARSTQPSIVALPVPRPYGSFGKVTNAAIEASLPDAVAAFVASLLAPGSGLSVDDGGRARPPSPRDVALLFKQMQWGERDRAAPFVEALEARGVACLGGSGRAAARRPELVALLTALEAIDRPDDELLVHAFLRGPYVALPDDVLLGAREVLRGLRDAAPEGRGEHGGPSGEGARSLRGLVHPLRPLSPDALAALREALGADADALVLALTLLRELHWERNRVPFSHTLARLLERLRGHAVVAFSPSGEAALASVLALVERARRLERERGASFRSLVERLRHLAQADLGDGALESADAVRLLTVHRAKGLEFPIVILCDPTAPLTPRVPQRHLDRERRAWYQALAGCVPQELLDHAADALARDRDEALRLAYVAATRARDLLVVPVVGDLAPEEEPSSWLGVLGPALYPARERRRAGEPLPGRATRGDDTVLERPERARVGTFASVRPGLHEPSRGSHRVAFWDPRDLELERPRAPGLLHREALVDAPTPVEVPAAPFEAHRLALAQASTLGGAPLVAATAVAKASPPDAADGPLAPVSTTAAPRTGRPRGARFGSLVHAVLAEVSLDAGEGEVAALASAHATLLGATDAEREHATVAVLAALAHPIFDEARAAEARGELRREVPVLVPHAAPSASIDASSSSALAGDASSPAVKAAIAADVLVDGVVDLAYRDERGWHVVDYKTDLELDPARHAAYSRQVALYVRAIEVATGEPCRASLLCV